VPRREPNIDWSYEGAPDPIAGTGASLAEQALMWAAGLAGAGLMIFLSQRGYLAWGWFQTVIGAVVAFDLVGGAVAFNLNSAKRFYHGPAQPSEHGLVRLMKGSFYVPATHVHPILVYFLYAPDDYLTGVAIYLAAAVCVALVRLSPWHLARPLAILLVLVASLVAIYGVAAIPGFEWLLPVFFLKLVLGFAVREEPYRPRGKHRASSPAHARATAQDPLQPQSRVPS
jgi:hypothetical protein